MSTEDSPLETVVLAHINYLCSICTSPPRPYRIASVERAPKRVKISRETEANLAPVVGIITDDLILDQVKLVSIEKYRYASELIINALNLELADLPRFLWNFESNGSSENDRMMVQVVQCVLTDFYSKCQRSLGFKPENERTFWIDRVVPIFQAFGDHTNLLGFQWCKVSIEDRVEFTNNPIDYARTAGNQFYEGFGYDQSGRSRLVLEWDRKEDIECSENNAVKLMHTSTELLESMLRSNAFASYESLSQLKAYSIQCICTTMTLTVMSMDPENPGKYVSTEVRFADIPVSYSNRTSWVNVFELIAYLFESLREQKEVIETVMKENSGLVVVADEDRAINVLARQ